MVLAGAICYVLLPVAHFPTSRRRRWWSRPIIPAPRAQVVADTVTHAAEQQITGVEGHDLHVLVELQ